MTTSCTIKFCAIIFSITKTFTPMLRRHKRRTGQLGVPSKGHLVSINTLTSTSTSTLASGAADAVSERGEVGIATAAAAVTAGQGRGGARIVSLTANTIATATTNVHDGWRTARGWFGRGRPGGVSSCPLLSLSLLLTL